MKKIKVGYWHGYYPNMKDGKLEGLKYEHLQEFEFSTRKRNAIIDDVLSKGFSVMLRPQTDVLMIWIDNGKFGQR